MMTGKELVAFCENKIGTNYVYGMKGEVMTESRYNMLKDMYGDLIWDSDREKIGTVCVDCSGLIGWATGTYYSSGGLYNNAKKKGSIKTIIDAPTGAILYKKGHVGVYCGNEYCIEAKGSAYGVVKTKISETAWTHWLLMDYIDYTEESTPEAESKYKPGLYEVKVNSLNRRTHPHPDAPLAGRALGKGDKLEVTEIKYKAWGYAKNIGAWANVSDVFCIYKGPLPEETPEQEETMIYIVKKGDNLSRIAKQYGTTVEKIVEINNIENPNIIYVGQKIKLPDEAKKTETYIPAAGDKVTVVGKLYSNRNGGKSIDVNRELYIVEIYTNGKFPIAFSKTEGGTVLGFGNKEVIK